METIIPKFILALPVIKYVIDSLEKQKIFICKAAGSDWKDMSIAKMAGRGLTLVLASLPKYCKHMVAVLVKLAEVYLPAKMFNVLDITLLFLIDVIRMFTGAISAGNLQACKRPSQPLILYEFEGCPFCRKVREALSVLAIDFLVQPCPRETLLRAGYCKNSRFRMAMKNKGKPLQFPYLEDPNTGVQLQNSATIISYLWKEYGAYAIAPANYQFTHWGTIETITLTLTTICRPMMKCGILLAPSKLPLQPLQLHGCEASGFCRLVRETLSSMEIPYIMHPTPLKHLSISSSSIMHPIRLIHEIIAGLAAPFRTRMIDPNTNVELTNFHAIVLYLKETYQLGNAPEESWLDYGKLDVRS